MADRRISNASPPRLAFFKDCIEFMMVGATMEERLAGKAVRRENTHLVFGRRRGKASESAEKCASNTRHTAFPPGYPSTQQPTDIIVWTAPQEEDSVRWYDARVGAGFLLRQRCAGSPEVESRRQSRSFGESFSRLCSHQVENTGSSTSCESQEGIFHVEV